MYSICLRAGASTVSSLPRSPTLARLGIFDMTFTIHHLGLNLKLFEYHQNQFLSTTASMSLYEEAIDADPL